MSTAAVFMSGNNNLTLPTISKTVSAWPRAMAPLVVGTYEAPTYTPTPIMAVAPIKSYITSSHPAGAGRSGAMGLVATGCASNAGAHCAGHHQPTVPAC